MNHLLLLLSRHTTTLCCLCLFAAFPIPDLAAQTQKVNQRITRAWPDLPTPEAPAEPVKLEYKFQDGETITWQFRSEAEMDVMGMIMPKLDQFVVDSRYETSDAGFRVTSRIKDMISEIRTRGGSLIIDTTNPERERADAPFKPHVKIWSVVRQNSMTCDFTRQGIVGEMPIPDEVQQMVNREGKGYGLQAETFIASLLIGIVQLPDEPVSPGDQWKMAVVIAPFPTDEESQTGMFLGTAEVEGRQMALIQVEYSGSTDDGKGMVSELETETVALVLFDIEAGSVFRSYSVAEMEMVLNLGDSEVVQVTSGKSTIEQVKD